MGDSAFEALVAAVSVVAGAVASIAGFGVGSLLTPVLALRTDMTAAVAAVGVPHAAATALRLWTLRAAVDREVLRGFGLASACGGLVGALLHGALSSAGLTVVFALLLILAGLSGALGLAERVRLTGAAAWGAGLLSGGFGGLAGNQGGVRSAALLGFGLQRDAFVATATAVALIIDAVRLPVYAFTSGDEMVALAGPIVLATGGALAGTLLGTRLLRHIPERAFVRVVSLTVLALGVGMLIRAI